MTFFDIARDIVAPPLAAINAPWTGPATDGTLYVTRHAHISFLHYDREERELAFWTTEPEAA